MSRREIKVCNGDIHIGDDFVDLSMEELRRVVAITFDYDKAKIQLQFSEGNPKSLPLDGESWVEREDKHTLIEEIGYPRGH